VRGARQAIAAQSYAHYRSEILGGAAPWGAT
jgi:hypothetical protein